MIYASKSEQSSIKAVARTDMNKSSSRRNIKKRRKSRRVYEKAILITLIVFSVLLFLNLTLKNTEASPDLSEERNKYYTSINIEQGDSMWSIAATYITDEYKDYNEYIAEVMSINGLKSENIKAGGRLCIPYYASEPLYGDA